MQYIVCAMIICILFALVFLLLNWLFSIPGNKKISSIYKKEDTKKKKRKLKEIICMFIGILVIINILLFLL